MAFSGERDRALIDLLPQIVWAADADGSVNFCNPWWQSYTFLTPELTHGQGWQRAIHPELRARVANLWRRAVRRDREWTVQLPFGRARDGTYRWHIVRGVPLRDAAGKRSGWIGTAVDIHDLVVAEQALRESEKRFRAVVDLVPDLLWSSDPTGGADWVNQRWSDYTGQTPDQARGWGWTRAIHPDDRERSRANLKRAIGDGRSLVQEHRIRGRDGSYRWFLMRIEPVRDEAGVIGRWFAAATDIDDQRNAFESLREREDHFRTSVELSMQVRWTAGVEGHITATDAHGKRGFQLDIVDGSPWTASVHPDDAERAKTAWIQALSTGRRLDVEARLRCASGDYRWQRIQAAARYDGNGKILRWYGSFDDVQERRETQQALSESEARYRALFESIDEGFCIIEPTSGAGGERQGYRFVAANPAFAAHTGVKDVVGKSLAEAFPGEPPDWCDLCLAVLKTGEPIRFEHELPSHRRLLDLYAFPLRDKAHLRLAVIFRDITARRQAEAALKRSEERFRQFAENMSNVMWIADPYSRILEYRSPAYERVWGEPRSSAPATLDHMASAVHHDDLEHVEASLQRVMSGEAVRFEFRIVRVNDGAIRWLRNTSFPIRGESAKVVKIAGVVEDLTRYEGIQIYLVGAADDEAQRLAKLLRGGGRRVKIFPALPDFLAVAAVLTPGCVIVDMRRSSRDAAAVLREIKARSSELPTIVIGRPDIETRAAIAAMKSGAVDVLQPPLGDELLNTAIMEATASMQAPAHPAKDADRDATLRLSRLSTREREVLAGLLEGGTNKTIAVSLGISPRTIELHRARLMERLNVDTLAQLLQVAMAAGFRSDTAKPPSAAPSRSM